MSRSHRTPYVSLATRITLQPWPCRNPLTGSLYPVPPGQSRQQLFCSHCKASTCIFGGTPAERRSGKRKRHWAFPSQEILEVYISALRMYADRLATNRTCWHCSNLRRVEGRGGLYICVLAVSKDDGNGTEPLLSEGLSACEAQLLTSVEGCGGVDFQARDGDIPCLTQAQWRALRAGERPEGRCSWCVHMRRLTVAGKERFICELEAANLPEHLVWRLARSWKVIRTRGRDTSWCLGQNWQLCAGAVPEWQPGVSNNV